HLSAGDPAIAQQLQRELGTSPDLRTNMMFASWAMHELLTPEVERVLGDRLGDPALLGLAAKIGRALRANLREPSSMSGPSQGSTAALSGAALDKVEAAIQRTGSTRYPRRRPTRTNSRSCCRRTERPA